jgi:glycosyltransferase involved in cell wall biosynthesis
MDELPVAVVIPAYNRAALLPRAIASVGAQRPYRPREIIVVDDASEDETAAVAAKLGARVVRHQVNLGPAAARNTGFAATDAPWLMQLDSDDEWLPHCLATLWALREGQVLVSGGSIGRHASGRAWYNGAQGSKPRVLKSPADLAFPDNFIASSAVLLRASCVHAVGGYRADLRYAEDLELWLRLLELGTGMATPIAVSLYHSHSSQATSVREHVQSGHARVLAMSVDRAWWRASLGTRWSAVPQWDAFRRLLGQRRFLTAAHHAVILLRHPQRLWGLACLLRYRVRGRRRSARMTLEGLPSVAVLPGATAEACRVDLDLSGTALPVALLKLIVRPTELAVVGRRWHIPLLAALGIRAELKPGPG